MSNAIIEALTEAQSAVEQAEIDERLKPVAFVAALVMQGNIVPAGFGNAVSASERPPRDESGVSHAGVPAGIAGLAAKLKVDVTLLDDIYYADTEGDLHLGVARSRLAKGRAEATRQLALLVAVSRQFDGRESFTESSVVRAVCQEYGVFDVGNFAKTVAAASDWFQFQGSGASRQVRVIRPGYEAVARIIEEIAG